MLKRILGSLAVLTVASFAGQMIPKLGSSCPSGADDRFDGYCEVRK